MNSYIVEEIVKWRMGAAYEDSLLDWRDNRLNFDSPALLDNALAGGITLDATGFAVHCPPGREGYAPNKHQRLVEAAEDINNARKDKTRPLAAFLVMNDARIFPSLEYVGEPINAVCAQISYARPAAPHWRAQIERILWPLSEYVRYWKMPPAAVSSWNERRPVLLWRGQTTGMSYSLGEETRPYFTGIRQMRRWLNVWLKEDVGDSTASFNRWADTYQRLIAVRKCMQIPDTDVRFVPMWDGDKTAILVAERHLGAQISSDRMTMLDYLSKRQDYKYVLSLPGNDVPSSLRHDLLSGCLVLMPKPFWESVWFFGLKPNVHYIELRADLADLEERLQWCRDNDAACREIAEAGRAFALEYFEPALEFEVQSRVADRLARQTMSVGSA